MATAAEHEKCAQCGLRIGERRAWRSEGDWFDSRADLRFVKEWDAVPAPARLRGRRHPR